MLKKLFAKIKEMNTVRGTIRHYTAHFTTVDGKEHSFNKCRYCIWVNIIEGGSILYNIIPSFA